VANSADRAYPGLRPFERTDSGRFFGRDAESADLRRMWRENPVTFLYGPAGVGKTSLLAAGVLPLVEGGNTSLLPVGSLSRGARSPVAALRAHNPYSLALLRSWSAVDTAELAGVRVDDFVRKYAERRDRSVSILAAIDQADDLFVGNPSSQRNARRFLDELAAALREQPTLHLLVSIREDSLPLMTEAIGEGEQFKLPALGIEAARLAAEQAGPFEPEAADELVRKIRTSLIVAASGEQRQTVSDNVEPALLQAACVRLRDSLRADPDSGVITAREMHRHGDVDAALSNYCGGAIAAVAASHGMQTAWLRFWLIKTFITEVTGLDSTAEGPVETAGEPRTVARAFEDRYLLRAYAGRASEPRWYELLGDRLIEPLWRTSDEMPWQEDPDDYLRAAERAMLKGELGLAEKFAGKARDDAPETALQLHAEAYSLLGNVCYERGQFGEAEAHYWEAASLFEVINDKNAVVRLLVAISRTLFDRGRPAEARAQLAAALNRASGATIQLDLAWVMTELDHHYPDDPPHNSSSA
jgi:tetratricopeptide (TPR) repeat protein